MIAKNLQLEKQIEVFGEVFQADFNKILRIVLNLDFGKNSFKMMIAQVF